ncbi:MAG: hypothetical protein CSA97_01415 [Bacteroidetes bacterium]|nr:MAG: hypothetical protein CSA97_01415 [Bacteroidota bacterium]
MKKFHWLLIVAPALLLASCGGGQNGGASEKAAGTTADSAAAVDSVAEGEVQQEEVLGGVDLAYVKDAKLYINRQEGGSMAVEDEVQPVLSCVFSGGGDLCYVADDKGKLVLKRLRLADDGGYELEQLCDLGLTPGDCLRPDGSPSKLEYSTFDDGESKFEWVRLPFNYSTAISNFIQAVDYDFAAGAMRRLIESDYAEEQCAGGEPDYTVDFVDLVSVPRKDWRHGNLYSDGGQLYYKDKCLTSELRLEGDASVEQIEYVEARFSPDRRRLLFGAVLALKEVGEGEVPFGVVCAANLDGTGQRIVLEYLDLWGGEHYPAWAGSSMVYLASVADNDSGEVVRRLMRLSEEKGLEEVASGVSYWCSR